MPVPSRRHPQRVRSLAEHLASVGKRPLIDAFEITGPPPQPDTPSAVRAAALLAALAMRPGVELPAAPVLLVDDTYRTGWTATVAAALLLELGASAVLPFALHQLP